MIDNLDRLVDVETTADEEEEEEEEDFEYAEVPCVDLGMGCMFVLGCTAGDVLIVDDCTEPVSAKPAFSPISDEDEVVGIALEEDEVCVSGLSLLSLSLLLSLSVVSTVSFSGETYLVSLTWVVLEEGCCRLKSINVMVDSLLDVCFIYRLIWLDLISQENFTFCFTTVWLAWGTKDKHEKV